MKFTANGSRIVSINAGPMVVRVHECRDADHCYLASRFYLSVDLKFRSFDLLRPIGWGGYTKTEATRKAGALCASITQTVKALDGIAGCALPEHAKPVLRARQEAEMRRLVGKYEAEIVD